MNDIQDLYDQLEEEIDMQEQVREAEADVRARLAEADAWRDQHMAECEAQRKWDEENGETAY